MGARPPQRLLGRASLETFAKERFLLRMQPNGGYRMATSWDRKIVLVGGGSYSWSCTLLSDLMQTPELDRSELVLLDPNLRAAREIAAAGTAMMKALGRRFQFTVTDSEPVAFRDADFVVITISTGGLDMMEHDLAIPERYGIYQTVGDTVGPGGWSRSLRNVPVFAHLGRQIVRFAPRAVILNYTNPMTVLTDTLIRVTGQRTVGLCHGVFANYAAFQRLFDVEEKDLCVTYGGINHFFWILDFTVRGQPGYPLLEKRLRGRPLDQALAEGSTDPVGYYSRGVLCGELYRQYGYLPYIGDRHTSEFLPGLLTNRSLMKRFQLERTTVRQRRALVRRARQRALAIARGKLPPPARTRETAVDIMLAVSRRKPFLDVVNLPNAGQIENLPRGAVVETLGLIDSLGFRPVGVGPMPLPLQRLLEPHCHVQRLTLEAALAGDRELALQALMMDPLCSHLPPDRVREMGSQLMAATKRYLPQFR